jgi:transposase
MPDITRTEVTVVARRTNRVYSLEFKQQIVKEALQPGFCVSSIARNHGISDNRVYEWCRLHRLGKLGQPTAKTERSATCTELLPVVIDAASSETVGEQSCVPPGCEVEIEVGKRRVLIRGLSMDRTERFLRECLQ